MWYSESISLIFLPCQYKHRHARSSGKRRVQYLESAEYGFITDVYLENIKKTRANQCFPVSPSVSVISESTDPTRILFNSILNCKPICSFLNKRFNLVYKVGLLTYIHHVYVFSTVKLKLIETTVVIKIIQPINSILINPIKLLRHAFCWQLESTSINGNFKEFIHR